LQAIDEELRKQHEAFPDLNDSGDRLFSRKYDFGRAITNNFILSSGGTTNHGCSWVLNLLESIILVMFLTIELTISWRRTLPSLVNFTCPAPPTSLINVIGDKLALKISMKWREI
jgi:hypothetical protein